MQTRCGSPVFNENKTIDFGHQLKSNFIYTQNSHNILNVAFISKCVTHTILLTRYFKAIYDKHWQASNIFTNLNRYYALSDFDM